MYSLLKFSRLQHSTSKYLLVFNAPNDHFSLFVVFFYRILYYEKNQVKNTFKLLGHAIYMDLLLSICSAHTVLPCSYHISSLLNE